MPFRVGLTGGIGCGKSKAAEIFADLGAQVIDSDAISHELTGPGGGAMSAIEQAFSRDYVRADGSLNRERMRSLVFSEPDARGKLEAILHPLIRAETARRMHAAAARYVILVVPLLLETGAYREMLDRILVIDCDESQQIARAMARSGLAEDEVRRIMSAQLPRAERVRQAQDVLSNDGDIETLRSKVEALHQQYLAAARAAR